jgi:hypothetical protein
MKPVDSSQLPFLLRLIDDPSPRVRERVRQQLRAYPNLKNEVRAQGITLTPSQRAALDEITSGRADAAFLVGLAARRKRDR